MMASVFLTASHRSFDPSCSRGQALAEATIILMALVVLWVSATWLFRLQDMALQTTHASRYAAFSAARGVDANTVQHKIRQHFYTGPAHQWGTLRTEQWLSEVRDEVRVIRYPDLAYSASDSSRHQTDLVSGHLSPWSVDGPQWATGHVTLQPRQLADRWAPSIIRQQGILVGAGHGKGDHDVLARLGLSEQGWSDSADRSVATGQGLAAVLQPLDAGWNRAQASFDWLSPWEGAIPEQYLQSWSGGQ